MKVVKFYSVKYGREYMFKYTPVILWQLYRAAVSTDNEIRNVTIITLK